MAKRESMSKSVTSVRKSSRPAPSTPLERQVVELAERMGRIAGRMQAVVDSMRPSRESKGGSKSSAVRAQTGRSGGKVDAPGKKHRKAPRQRRGVKHSEQAIAKVTGLKQVRPPRRG
jgi:hypothetical protein